jgi:hypothetical protein
MNSVLMMSALVVALLMIGGGVYLARWSWQEQPAELAVEPAVDQVVDLAVEPRPDRAA